jgi:hypothetical protein
MEKGHWKFNGDALRFDVEGNHLDGQHRLMAMCLLNDDTFSLHFLVVAGLETESQSTMDQGAKRSFGDFLALGGSANAMALAAVTRKALLWDRGDVKFAGNFRPTITEMQEYIDAHPEVHRSTEVALRIRSAFKGLPPSVLGVAHMVFMRSDPDQAPWFFERLLDGHMIPKGHPVYTLRERLLRPREKHGERTAPEEYMALMIRAWNAYRKNDTLDRIIGIHKGVMPKID